MKVNVKNLEKLARGLMNVPKNQFGMASFQNVFDGELFAAKHPTLAREEKKNYCLHSFSDIEGYEVDALGPHFAIKHECGTAGCALGWAPTLVKRGRKGESWSDYCERVFGVDIFEDAWDYMFSSHWKGAQNTPEATAGRIMYFVKNGDTPDAWDTVDTPVILPEFEAENA